MDPARFGPDGGKWAVWAGIEAEGRYRGIPTLFFARVPAGARPGDFADRPERHAYLNPSCWDDGDTPAVDGFVTRLLDAGWAVTLALRPMQFRLPAYTSLERCHLMAVIDVPDLAALPLKPTDTIRLDSGPFVNHSAMYGHLDRCLPGDYAGDRPVGPATGGPR